MAETKLAFELGSSLATQVLTQSKYIKAGYIVVNSIAERDALTKFVSGGSDGVLVDGTPVYVAGTVKKAYRYFTTGWQEETSGKSIQTIKKNGTEITPGADGSIDIIVPTKTSEFTNDGNGVQVEGEDDPFATKSEVTTIASDLIKDYHKADVVICSEAANTPKDVKALIPATGDTWTEITGTLEADKANLMSLYYVRKKDSKDNIYFQEYKSINVGTITTPSYKWEMVGTTEVDLSGKQNKLVIPETYKNITLTDKTDDSGNAVTEIKLASDLTGISSIGFYDGVENFDVKISADGSSSKAYLKLEAWGEDGQSVVELRGGADGTNSGKVAISGNVEINGSFENNSSLKVNGKTVATTDYLDDKFTYDSTTKTLTIL